MDTWCRQRCQLSVKILVVVNHLADSGNEIMQVFVIMLVVIDRDTCSYVLVAVLLEPVQGIIYFALIISCRSKLRECRQVWIILVEVVNYLQAVQRALLIVAAPQLYRTVTAERYILKHLVHGIRRHYAHFVVRQCSWLCPCPTAVVVL